MIEFRFDMCYHQASGLEWTVDSVGVVNAGLAIFGCTFVDFRRYLNDWLRRSAHRAHVLGECRCLLMMSRISCQSLMRAAILMRVLMSIHCACRSVATESVALIPFAASRVAPVMLPQLAILKASVSV